MVFNPGTSLAGTSVYLGPMSNTTPMLIKRPIHALSNGNAVAVTFNTHDSASYVGNKNNVGQIQLMESNADRSTWTTKATWNLPSGTYGTGGNALHCGSVRLNDDSIFVVWRSQDTSASPGFQVRGALFTRSGSTWTNPSAAEFIWDTNVRHPMRFDLDVNKANGHIFIGWMYLADASATTNKIGMQIAVRRAANTYVQLDPDLGLGSDGNISGQWGSEDFSLAVDPMSTSLYTRLVYITSVAASNKDYGDYVGYRVVRNSDSVTVGKGFIQEGFNASRGGGRRTTYLWANANGETSAVGICGFDTADAFAVRWKTTDAITSITPTYTVAVPVTYSPVTYQMNRTGSNFSDASAAYANNNFVALFHDDVEFRNMVGKFDGDRVVWDTSEYTWDSYKGIFLGGSSSVANFRNARPAAIYGGSRDTDTQNNLDALLAYYNMSSWQTTASGFAAQHNRPWRGPEQVLPSLGSSVSTSIPTLKIYADIDMPDPRSALYARFMLAKDAAFTVSPKTLNTSSSVVVLDTHVTGTYKLLSEALPHAMALDTGLWYIKAAQVDAFGTVGSWSAVQSFTVSHAPWGTDLAPSGSRILSYGLGNVTFTWKFHDGYEFDSQTSYRILITRNSDSSVVVDTGKVSSGDQFATVAIPVGAKNETLAWQVQLWDSDDNGGTLSAAALFVAADPPSVNVTYPTPGLEIDNARPTITWITTDPIGTGQAAYRVYFLSEDGISLDSGWVNGSATAYTPTAAFLENLTSYDVVVMVRDGAGIEGQTTVPFTTSWDQPAAPDMTMMQADGSQYDVRGKGFVRVRWQYATTETDFLSYRLYRRFHLPSSAMAFDKGIQWELIHEEYSVSPTDGTDTFTFLDYAAPSAHMVAYVLTQTALRFGSIVESPMPAITDAGATLITESSHYWLIDPAANGDPEDAIRLEATTQDSYTDPYESEEMQIIGRGRHVEIGDRLGYTGQLTLPLRFIAGVNHPDDPRRQKLDLEEFRARKSACYIRSPFGDIFMAAPGDMSFERVAGVGGSEFINVTLPYREVYSSGN